jgi:hypothetical protein
VVVLQEAGVEKMVEYDENGKLVIPEKETQPETKKPQSTEQSVTQLLDKKKQITETKIKQPKPKATKTKVKVSTRRKAGGTPEQLKQREKWRQTYQRLKPKYREWNRRYRENLKAKKLAEQKKSKKKVT